MPVKDSLMGGRDLAACLPVTAREPAACAVNPFAALGEEHAFFPSTTRQMR
jgi:hypothetical protein